MNPVVTEEDDLFAAADERLGRLQARALDTALLKGGSDVSEMLSDPVVQNMLAQRALQEAAVSPAKQKPPGPRRRPKKHPTRRQRVKAARRANR